MKTFRVYLLCGLIKVLVLFLFSAVATAPDAFALQADLNCDGQVSFKDINPFVLRLSAPEVYFQQYPTCPPLNGDMNGDGEVTFQDINRFVNAIVACGSNTPPQALAEASPLDAAPGELVNFDGSGSLDLQGNIESYTWTFGDGSQAIQGEMVSHGFNAPGSYAVDLSVTDACGAAGSDSIIVVVQSDEAECQVSADCSLRCAQNYSCVAGQCVVNENSSLCADFRVEELVKVDPDGTEHWERMPADSNGVVQIEQGLTVRLNGTYSTAVAWYEWWQNSSCVGTDAIINRTYPSDASYTLRLVVYNEDGSQIDETSLPLNVQGMTLLSSSPNSFVDVSPRFVALDGTNVWVLTQTGRIGYLSVADPYNLPALQVMDVPVVPERYGFAWGEGKLYVARALQGLNIYRADPSDFTLASHLSVAELGFTTILGVAARGNTLYVSGVGLTAKMSILDCSVPESPQLMAEYALQDQLPYLQPLGDDAVLLYHFGSSQPIALDIREPFSPQPLPLLGSVPVLQTAALNYASQLVVSAYGGAWHVGSSLQPSGELSVSHELISGLSFTSGAFFPGRMYRRMGYDILKYDVTRANAPYLMETLNPIANGENANFVLDPDGPGPMPLCLFVGYLYGFRAFTP